MQGQEELRNLTDEELVGRMGEMLARLEALAARWKDAPPERVARLKHLLERYLVQAVEEMKTGELPTRPTPPEGSFVDPPDMVDTRLLLLGGNCILRSVPLPGGGRAWAATTRHIIAWDPDKQDIDWPAIIAQRVAEWPATHFAFFQDRLQGEVNRALDVLAFRKRTHGVTYRKQGEDYQLLLPHDLQAKVDALPEADRSDFLDEVYKPYLVEMPAPAPKGLEEEFTTSLRVAVHPPVVDMDLDAGGRVAYFPVSAEIRFEPPPGVDLERWTPPEPGEWPEALQKEAGANVFAALVERVSWTFTEPQDLDGKSPEEVLRDRLQRRDVGEALVQKEPDRYLLNAPTRWDRQAALLKNYADRIRLPRKWETIPRLKDLEQEEVGRLLDEHGDAAFEDLAKTTKNPNARGPLLERNRRFRPGGAKPEFGLTKEAKAALLERQGDKPFRQVVDGKEYLVRRLKVSGGGEAVFRISWNGQAWPLVEGARRQEAQRLQELKLRDAAFLWNELTPAERDVLDHRLRTIGAIGDARRVLSHILNAFSAQGRNPVHIPAWEFRTLLECANDPHGHQRVVDCLQALRGLDFHLEFTGRQRMEGAGAFLAEWEFIGSGPGKHTDGDFYLSLTSIAVGSLQVFGTSSYKLRHADKVFDAQDFDFQKQLPKEKRQELDFIRGFSTLAPFFDRAKGFTPAQSQLREWMENEITRAKDGTAPGRRHLQAKKNDLEADEPRTYGREFCPLLPEGKKFHGALGHFKAGRNEQGRKLFGTPARGSRKSGPRTGGLLDVMGYQLPPGGARRRRHDIARQALQDMRAVVEEALGGIVAAKNNGEWLRLEDAAARLDVEALLRETTWFLFLPEDWPDRYEAEIELHHEKRHAAGETPYRVRTTRDRNLKDRAERERRGDHGAASGEPLRLLLARIRQERGLKQEDVGRLFGVSKMTISLWERGTEPDEQGQVKGKPIPRELVPLVERWTRTGEAPTPAELASRRTSRAGRREGQ